jgi:hypothetical protein
MLLYYSQSTYKEKKGSVSALSAGAYTTALYVMVDRVKECGRAQSALTFHHDEMYARKWPLPLCLLCGLHTEPNEIYCFAWCFSAVRKKYGMTSDTGKHDVSTIDLLCKHVQYMLYLYPKDAA